MGSQDKSLANKFFKPSYREINQCNSSKMLEDLFTNVFGRPKNKTSNRQGDSSAGQASGLPQMTGPFSTTVSQMPQPPNLPYPVAPYPSLNPSSPANSALYPNLPFSQPPAAPGPYGAPIAGGGATQPYNYPTGTLAAQVSPLDSVPFEIKISLGNSTNLVTLDQLFKDIKKAADVVDRADAYLRSRQSDYDFKTEQGLIYQ